MDCKDFEIPRKTTKIFDIYFKKKGASVDITGWTFYFIAKVKMNDSDTGAPIYKEITSHTNALAGNTVIELTTSDTDIEEKNYHYSIDYVDDSGNEGVIVSGYLKICKRVKD